LMQETGSSGENHRTAESNWQAFTIYIYIYRSLEDCATIPIKCYKKYIDKIFDQQMTFLGVYQS
jgi:hypothetical protein